MRHWVQHTHARTNTGPQHEGHEGAEGTLDVVSGMFEVGELPLPVHTPIA